MGHAPLLKSCYGLLMLLPQSDAFKSLNDRLATVCNLRDNLGIAPSKFSPQETRPGLSKRQKYLLSHFDRILALHHSLRGRDTHSDLHITSANATKMAARVLAGGTTNSSPAQNGRGRTQEV